MKNILYILFCIITIISCKKEKYVQPDYIVFGAIQGDCGTTDCRFIYYLDAQNLKEDENVKYFSTQNLVEFSTTLSSDKFIIAKDLLNKVPVELTETNRNLFVDLNAANPNLWYAQIKLNNRIYTWSFDNSPSSTPSYLKPFAETVINTCMSLQ